MRLFKDGDAWCAVGHRFRDLNLDPAGFGDTQEEAVAALIADRGFQTRQKRITARTPKLEDFVVSVVCPRCREFNEEGAEPDGCRDPYCPLMEGR